MTLIKKSTVNSQLNQAVRKGLIQRPDNCSSCGKACSVHGHHPDYGKPLEVVWLCQKCHGACHCLSSKPIHVPDYINLQVKTATYKGPIVGVIETLAAQEGRSWMKQAECLLQEALAARQAAQGQGGPPASD